MKRLVEQTLYEILEIPQDATSGAIEAAVERIRALYGPGSLATYTLMSPDEAELLATRVDEARRTLLDPERRASYDASLSPPGDEVRAAVNASAGPLTTPAPSFGPLPPVIPAVSAEPPPPPPAELRPPERPMERPTERPAERPMERPAAQREERPAATPPPIPMRQPIPIRLEREVAPEPPAAPPPAEIPMPDGAAWTGEALRRVREARGISVAQIAERTKVTRHHVENIEGERFSSLPAPVYLRGILLALARELRLDGPKVARAYLDRAAAAGYADRR